MKVCNGCKTLLDDSEFWKNQNKCKACYKILAQSPTRREQLRVAGLKSYYKNHATNLTRSKKYYHAHKEEANDKAKRYKKENKDKWNAYMDKWRKENAEQHARHTQEWRERYPERAERCKLTSALRVELGVEPPEDLIDLILAKCMLNRAIKESKYGTK